MTAQPCKWEDGMTLQNRVDPFGVLHAIPARGLFTGNRGVIHDPATRTLLSRRWTTKAWIICSLKHPHGIRRQPMGRNRRGGGAGWTELFFLDEVTALAAGHRPCFYCRRDQARLFSTFFAAGNDMDTMTASAPAMDTILHRQRLVSAGKAYQPGQTGQQLGRAELAALPDGAMIEVNGHAFALRQGQALPWSFTGYAAAQALPQSARLLTPPATLLALMAGFKPAWHSGTS